MEQGKLSRKEIRKTVREKRRQLSSSFQQQASLLLVEQVKRLPSFKAAKHIALYFANDGELDVSPLIEFCWLQDKQVYLPVIHPFSDKHLIFLRYHATSPMVPNKFGILEPLVETQNICPISQLNIIFTPLVAFDSKGNRLGMGGGFYDRTLAPITNLPTEQQADIIGLAHDCQKIENVPFESWDIPLPTIITPTQVTSNR